MPKRRPQRGGDGPTPDSRWWRGKDGDVHRTLIPTAKSIHERTTWLRVKDTAHAELYECEGALRDNQKGDTYQTATTPHNLIRSAVDTLCAKVAKERPLPQVFTNRGDWGLQKKARRASEAIEGEFSRCKIFEELWESWVTDALTSRAGVLKICEQDGRIHVERVLPWELHVDPRDGRYGKPRNLYHVRTVDAAVLAERYPDHREAIFKGASTSQSSDWDEIDWESSSVDRVRVIESWHLPEGPKTAGRHVVCIDGHDLLDEDWIYDWFPFEVLIYKPRKTGYWGYPLAELLEGRQYNIDMVAEKIAEAVHMAPAGVVVTDSDMKESDISNGVAYVLKVRPGAQITWLNPDPFNPQMLDYMRFEKDDGMQESGVSAMSARSQKPSGLNSGKALQVFDDVETERFAMFVRRTQAACVGLAEKMLAFMRAIAEADGDYRVTYSSRRGRVDLTWAKDFELPEESYHLKVFNTSLLSKRPEARFEQLESWVTKGWITPEIFFRLSEMPDLQREADLMTSARDLVDDQIQDMLDSDEPEEADSYQAPLPYSDLKYALQRAQLSLCLAAREKCPEGNLDLLRQFIDDCKRELHLPPYDAPAVPPPVAAASTPLPAQGGPDTPPGPSGPAAPPPPPPPPMIVPDSASVVAPAPAPPPLPMGAA